MKDTFLTAPGASRLPPDGAPEKSGGLRSEPRPMAAFPTADQIALAIVAACRITGEGPMGTCMRQPSRARNIALAALMEVFPDARRQTLARCCGYPKPAAGTTTLAMARKAAWWNDDHVDEVIGALTAGEYGEQAA